MILKSADSAFFAQKGLSPKQYTVRARANRTKFWYKRKKKNVFDGNFHVTLKKVQILRFGRKQILSRKRLELERNRQHFWIAHGTRTYL